MITATLKQTLKPNKSFPLNHFLYAVSVKEHVLYVGQSKNPRHRLLEHVGLAGREGDASQLGELIYYNLPSALSWQVRLLTLTDCSKYGVTLPNQGNAWNQSAVNTAEEALIHCFKPCLNILLNFHPSPLPATIVDPGRLMSRLPHPSPRFFLKELVKGGQAAETAIRWAKRFAAEHPDELWPGKAQIKAMQEHAL